MVREDCRLPAECWPANRKVSDMALSFDYDRICAAPDCDVRFTPKQVTQKYHSRACAEKATHNRARDTRRAAAREKTCVICGRSFTATDRRQQRCQQCAEIRVITVTSEGQETVRTVKVPASGKLPAIPAPVEKTCAECGNPFTTTNKRAMYCRPACKRKAWYRSPAAYRAWAKQWENE